MSHGEKKQVIAAINKANQTDKKQKSAQDSIPYEHIWPDGICRVTENHYTKTVQFHDINYQLSQNEDKTAIFEAWCDFLNFFDSSIQFQFSFLNLSVGMESFERSVFIPASGDGFDDVRAEYAEMLQNQLAKGNNGLTKTKFLTFGIDAENYKAAKPRLERIETDIYNNFKRLGVSCESLSGAARLRLMHSVFHMDDGDKFQFGWDWLAPSGLSTKDFIAPSSFEFKNGRHFRMGKKYGAASFLSILAPELNDRMLADFLDMESSLVINMHIQSVDQVDAIKTIKRKITDLDIKNQFSGNRLVCFNIKELGQQLKKLGMLIVQDQVWGRVTANRAEGKSTRYYIDEFHLLLREEQTAAYSVEIWKRFRKWGGIPTGITQNVKDLLSSREVENIFDNSDFIYMLNQSGGDRAILAKQLNISPLQLSYVTHSGEGEGLLFYGNVIIPFIDHFPKDSELYRIMTTKLNEVLIS